MNGNMLAEVKDPLLVMRNHFLFIMKILFVQFSLEFIRLFTFIHLFSHLNIHPFIHLFLYLFIHGFLYLFIHLFNYLFIHLFMYLFIHWFIYLFIHPFIYLLIYNLFFHDQFLAQVD